MDRPCPRPLVAGPLALALALACADSPGDTQTHGDATAASTSTASGSTADLSTGPAVTSTSSGAAATTQGASTGAGDTDCEFVCGGDNPGADTCDIWAQDCPEGHKCMPYDDYGVGFWAATKCTPVAPDPGQVDQSCVTQNFGLDGVDDCDEGLMCWFFDQDGAGACVSLCTGSIDAPTCPPDELCQVTSGAVLNLCLDLCDPVAVDCPEGLTCRPTASWTGHFTCDVEISGDLGALGDPCKYVHACDPGLVCLAGLELPGCAEGGCCVPYCDLGDPQCPPTDPPLTCTPWHEPGEAPAGLEHVGVCR